MWESARGHVKNRMFVTEGEMQMRALTYANWALTGPSPPLLPLFSVFQSPPRLGVEERKKLASAPNRIMAKDKKRGSLERKSFSS